MNIRISLGKGVSITMSEHGTGFSIPLTKGIKLTKTTRGKKHVTTKIGNMTIRQKI